MADESQGAGPTDEEYDKLYDAMIEVYVRQAVTSLHRQKAAGTLFPRFCEGEPFALKFEAQFRPSDIKLLAARLGIRLPLVKLITA